MRQTGRRMAHRRGGIRLALGGLMAAACTASPPVEPAPPATRVQPTLAEPAPCTRIERIEVRTGARKLRAWCEDGRAVEMRAAMGRRRGGPKRVRGDMRTPLGLYRVAGPARPSRFHLSIPLDYPSRVDAAEALSSGLISEESWQRIVAAHERGVMPPQDTDLGGHLGLHGEGRHWRGATAHLDWTLGCVALRDREIEFLAQRVAPGTPVLLFP